MDELRKLISGYIALDSGVLRPIHKELIFGINDYCNRNKISRTELKGLIIERYKELGYTDPNKAVPLLSRLGFK